MPVHWIPMQEISFTKDAYDTQGQKDGEQLSEQRLDLQPT